MLEVELDDVDRCCARSLLMSCSDVRQNSLRSSDVRRFCQQGDALARCCLPDVQSSSCDVAVVVGRVVIVV